MSKITGISSPPPLKTRLNLEGMRLPSIEDFDKKSGVRSGVKVNLLLSSQNRQKIEHLSEKLGALFTSNSLVSHIFSPLSHAKILYLTISNIQRGGKE